MRVQWLACLALGGCAPPATRHVTTTPVRNHPSATWPWPGSTSEALTLGTSRWSCTADDGTTLELLRFDFSVNPRLRLELYDQDQDDAKPFDNETDYYPRGVGHVVRHLLEQKKGRVVAAWNGPFFGYDKKRNPPHGFAKHVGPVFLDGAMHYNVGRPRWCFGVRNGKFAVVHCSELLTKDTPFDFGAAGLQCLIKEGLPLKLQPPPSPYDPPLVQPVPCAADEAGHIPRVDHIRTSRASIAWSKDSRQLYVLVVNEPDNETESWLALKRGKPLGGGFTLNDLQRFWLAFSKAHPIWGAINSDGGAVTQLTYLRHDAKYEMLPARIASPNVRRVFGPEFAGAPAGGSLMTFYVRETTP